MIHYAYVPEAIQTKLSRYEQIPLAQTLMRWILFFE